MVKIGMLIADRYEVLEKIGTGGMSAVYKAKDHKLNRYVAIKVLKQEFSDNANFVSKFRVEAQAAAGLMHPNIVNVYDVGDENGMYYIVMELVDGITLKKYIEKKSRLSVKEAVSIAIQVSMGLEAAHHNHIIHRDIKPQNIIISKDGKVKVTDFGIAKAATSNTITSNVMGSVHYTSPEQARGGYSDERSDIYSLGITMFEMLTGRVPFNGETTVAIAIKHIQEPMPSPCEFVPDIPRSVEQIVLKCCEKSPDRRYQNMEELIADLKQSLIHPDDDFVKVIHPDEESATRLAQPEEQGAIRRRTMAGSAAGIADGYSGQTDSGQEYTGTADHAAPDYGHYIDDPDGDYESGSTGYGRNGGSYRQNSGGRRQNASDDLGAPLRRNPVSKRYDQDDYTDDFDGGSGGYDVGRERRVTIISVLAAVLIGLVVIAVAGWKLGLFDSLGGLSGSGSAGTTAVADNGTVTLPQLSGVNADDLTKTLEGMGLTVGKVYADSDTVQADLVISAKTGDTVLNEGDAVAVGTDITLTVSAGANGIEVPDVVDKTIAEAKSILQAKGFLVSQETAASDTIDKNHVIEQDPAAGSEAPAGSKITITISTGPDASSQVDVPQLTGLTQDAAVQALQAAGLQAGTITQDNSDQAVGTVISQSVEAGTKADPDSTVDFVISSGPKVVTYSYNDSIQAPTAEEDPNYVAGTPVYIVMIAADGTKLLDTTRTDFPYAVSFTGLSSATATLQMGYTDTTQATVTTDENGNQVVTPGQQIPMQITRQITFTPEN